MTPTPETVERLARAWVFSQLRRDYSFYDEATCRAFLHKAEGRTRIEAFIAGYNAANPEKAG